MQFQRVMLQQDRTFLVKLLQQFGGLKTVLKVPQIFIHVLEFLCANTNNKKSVFACNSLKECLQEIFEKTSSWRLVCADSELTSKQTDEIDREVCGHVRKSVLYKVLEANKVPPDVNLDPAMVQEIAKMGEDMPVEAFEKRVRLISHLGRHMRAFSCE